MKKAVTIFFLLLIILATFSFLYLKTSALDAKNNFFNINLRYQFARYPLARKILGLHFAGDAKSDYLGSAYKDITVIIIPMEGLGIDDETARNFAQKAQAITGKQIKYLYYPSIPFQPVSDTGDLEKQLLEKNNALPFQGAVIYLMLASQSEGDSNQLGSTLEENGIVLFENTLANAMRNDTSQNTEDYETALLLHEFGHQIGLDHNDMDGCLMNAKTEFSDSGRLLNRINDFCDFEREQIREMKF